MKIQDCIDAGTEYCPCYLAETGECIMCSQLQGKVFCDCINWKGVCIYQEYIWNHSRNKDNRQGEYCRILAKNNVPPTVTLLKIEVPKTLARELNQPGAYVFLRTAQDTAYFDMPISVMRADERAGTIEVAIQEKGIKTKYLRLGEAVDTADTADTADTVESAELAEAAGKSEQGIFLRGPYWNGVLGLKYLKSFQKGKALMIVRGIGQAPALAVAKKLLQGGNEVEVVLDEGWIKADLTMKLFQELGCSVLKKEALDLAKLTLTENGYRFDVSKP